MKTPNLELAEVSLSSTPEANLLNDAFWRLDAIVQLCVLDITLSVPPADATQGARYIVAGPATGLWARQERRIAEQTPAGWVFISPRAGWVARVMNEEGRSYEFTGTTWLPLLIPATNVGVDGTESLDEVLAGYEERITALEQGASGELATQILADGPLAFWKCDEVSGTTLADSSGNSFALTLTGTYVLAAEILIPKLPTTKFLHVGTGSTSFASRAGTLGLSTPINRDWTIEAIVHVNTTGVNTFFSITASGETSQTNYQISLQTDASLNLRVFWESAAGNNIDNILSGSAINRSHSFHLLVTNDNAAKFLSFFVDGIYAGGVGYGTLATDGSTTSTYLGGDVVNGGGDVGIAYVAFYTHKLTQERVMAHALAAGLA